MTPTASPTTPTNPASTLGEVIRCVVAIFAAVEAPLDPAARTSILRGKFDLVTEDAPPRVLFIPDTNGTWGDAPTGSGGTGYVGGIAQGCTCYVWGASDTDPFHADDIVDALVGRVINALERAARGRIAGGPYTDPSPQSVSSFGEARSFRFVYSRGVQRDAPIWALPASALVSPQDPARPPGSPASTVVTVVTTTPQS